MHGALERAEARNGAFLSEKGQTEGQRRTEPWVRPWEATSLRPVTPPCTWKTFNKKQCRCMGGRGGSAWAFPCCGTSPPSSTHGSRHPPTPPYPRNTSAEGRPVGGPGPEDGVGWINTPYQPNSQPFMKGIAMAVPTLFRSHHFHPSIQPCLLQQKWSMCEMRPTLP